MKKPSWNSRGGSADQVNFLLGEIGRLRADHQITGASVVAHWSLRRVQPLQRLVHLGFQYTGEADPSHFSRSKISEDDLKDGVTWLLKNMAGTTNIAGTFSAGRRPWEVLLRVVDCSVNRVLLSSSQVDLVSFVQINHKKLPK